MNFIKQFAELSINDVPIVGGKNASLGEMIQKLSTRGVTIPSGFAVTAEGYRHHLRENNLEDELKRLLDLIDTSKLDNFAEIGKQIRQLISSAPLPNDLAKEIKEAYELMEKEYGANCDVAVRSSATAEDLPEASFAGQQETYLNIQGSQALLKSCPHAFASLFTNRAISYRIHHGFNHLDVALSIGVQKMVRSDKSSAGVIFTLDTESGFRDVIMINSAYGLGESVVQGSINPDEFFVHKPTLKDGFKPILKKRIGEKHTKIVYSNKKSGPIQTVPVTKEDQHKASITDEEILSLAKQALTIEEYYTELKGQWCPMDIEWGKDGIDGKLYILQARPETIHSRKQHETFIEEYILDTTIAAKATTITTGKSIGKKIVSGKARVISSPDQISSVQAGDILITDMTDPDWEPIMKIAAAIITNRGGRTCHAAIVSRELGIPAIVGTNNATDVITHDQEITVDCSDGEIGRIFDGTIPYEVKKITVDNLKKPPVDIMMNLGNPDQAFNLAKLPCSGIGLARLEFIINSGIQIHPMALVHLDKVTDPDEKKKIDELTINYNDKQEYFVDKLAQEAGTIAAAFYPRPVIIRMSDFKSNEYKKLIGGQFFEPEEENPMIGFRGASRYTHEKYKEAFKLECLAMKKMRDEMGLTNVILMLPFVRTIDEAHNVIGTMNEFGLKQGENKLEFYMMVEIPSNVILIDHFAKLFDGFSIGSNDLTQFTLAVDRDSELVAPIFDERNEAVKKMLKIAIDGAKKAGKKIGICGQGPSDYPELAQFLVECDIDSMSLNPDTVLKEIVKLSNSETNS